SPGPARRWEAARRVVPSLAALLHVVLDELLGVLLEDLVDLVEQVIESLELRLGLGSSLRLLGALGLFSFAGLRPFSVRHLSTSLAFNQVGSVFGFVDESADSRSVALQWLHHRNTLQRRLADVEHQRIPVGGDQGAGVLGDTTAPEVGTGPRGRLDGRPFDLLVG